jgi:triphosphatase
VLSEPVPALAAGLLTRLHTKALKHGTHMRHLDPDGRHALRIRLKRLRYAAEFFQPLWPGQASERFVRQLSRLQNTLGADSDVEATRPLLETIRAEAATPELHGAMGALIGWQACHRLTALQLLRKRWQRFKVAAPFWEVA